MSKYVYLPQTSKIIPEFKEELVYADMSTIVYKSFDKENIIENLSDNAKKFLKFHSCVDTTGTYSRFNPKDFYYDVNPDTEVTPLIDLNYNFDYDFYDLTDTRSLELIEKSNYYDKIFVFWSGGIDSTLILSAILKNCNRQVIEKLVVALNDNSINEYPDFYYQYIHDKLTTVSIDLFYSDKLKFSNKNLYVAADTADVIIGHSNIVKFDRQYPNILNDSYAKHGQKIIEYFGSNRYAYYSYQRVLRSIRQSKLDIRTVFDFLAWIEFAWSFDHNCYFYLWNYSLLPEHIDTKDFLTNNIFDWFKDIRYQYWSVSAINSDLRIRNDIKTYKYIYKKYIFDFNHDNDYFTNKIKEASTPKNMYLHHGKKLVAIDKNWTIYYR